MVDQFKHSVIVKQLPRPLRAQLVMPSSEMSPSQSTQVKYRDADIIQRLKELKLNQTNSQQKSSQTLIEKENAQLKQTLQYFCEQPQAELPLQRVNRQGDNKVIRLRQLAQTFEKRESLLRERIRQLEQPNQNLYLQAPNYLND